MGYVESPFSCRATAASGVPRKYRGTPAWQTAQLQRAPPTSKTHLPSFFPIPCTEKRQQLSREVCLLPGPLIPQSTQPINKRHNPSIPHVFPLAEVDPHSGSVGGNGPEFPPVAGRDRSRGGGDVDRGRQSSAPHMINTFLLGANSRVYPPGPPHPHGLVEDESSSPRMYSSYFRSHIPRRGLAHVTYTQNNTKLELPDPA